MTKRSPRLPVGTRGQIIELLRRSPRTATEIAEALDVTYNAVRPHLAEMERDGLVRRGEVRRGETRPAVLYEVAPEAEASLSLAYVPFSTELVRVLGERVPEADLEAIMREVGRRVAAGFPAPRGPLSERVKAAAGLLESLGAANDVDSDGPVIRIRGFGCVLGELVQDRPAVCRAIETMLSELVGAPVREACERGARPRCCFTIDGAP